MVKIEKLRHSYHGSPVAVIDDISIEIPEGEYVALIGPNGCGKTTLARHLNGLLIPQEGRITVDGADTRDKHRLSEVRRTVGMIFQNPENQIVGTTVEEDIAFGPANRGLPPAEIRSLVTAALARVGLSGFEARHPHTLSGGEKQLLALAGVLAMRPRYVVLDEPTSSLDPVSRERVLSVIHTLNAEGIGIVHITHTMEDIVQAHRVIAIHEGRVAADGAPWEVLGRVEWLKSIGLAPPRITDLMWQLHRIDKSIEPGAVTVDQAVSRISAHLLRTGGNPAVPEEQAS